LPRSIHRHFREAARERVAVNQLVSAAVGEAPGLGTAVGEMPVSRCAYQMRTAFEIGYPGRIPRHLTLGDAAEAHVWCVNK
jgi:hypothetical protein